MENTNKTIKIRVIADSRVVEDIANKLIDDAANLEMRFIEKSKTYPCRPPNQNESRIYLTFEDES